MTVDELINKLLEAKEHCIPGNTEINVWKTDMFNLANKDKLEGVVVDIDYDNTGINLY
jgi:hypothetical protein